MKHPFVYLIHTPARVRSDINIVNYLGLDPILAMVFLNSSMFTFNYYLVENV